MITQPSLNPINAYIGSFPTDLPINHPMSIMSNIMIWKLKIEDLQLTNVFQDQMSASFYNDILMHICLF